MNSTRARPLLLLVAVIVGSTLPGAAAGASTAGFGRLDGLAGQFSGTDQWNFGEGCSFVHEVFDATYPGDPQTHTVVLHVDTCVGFGPPGFVLDGTFVIDTKVGSLEGTAMGSIDDSSFVFTYTLSLTVTSGTRAFRNAAGATLSVVVESSGAQNPPGTYSMTGALAVG